ncbi:sensor histidine kinase [Xanthovirga aplysinae]|uniref:sensor histidine kinase n=1 Tax=Xanthovirga aplysinae TaxID=2529853 RepID=UPI0012BB8C24|nr:HAMP domain-containing sensor histidine kinase [Xanthovirga aplysinae]MTI32479.1 HAMP domain-containing histidine kinase [Xanthovirga aplysinae]
MQLITSDFNLSFRKFPKPYPLLVCGLFLLTAYLFKHFLIDPQQRPDNYIKEISTSIDRELGEMDGSLDMIERRIQIDSAVLFHSYTFSENHFFYIFKNKQLAYWSDDLLVPSYSSLSGKKASQFINLEEGQYVVRRQRMKLGKDNYEIFGLIPIFYNSKINNKYVGSGFNFKIFSSSYLSIRSQQTVGWYWVYRNGEDYLFSVEFGPGYHSPDRVLRILLLLLQTGAIFCALLYGYRLVRMFINEQRFLTGFVFSLLYLGVLRWVMLYQDFPFSVVEFELFDPRFYASSSFSPSLGDLFLNVCYAGIIAAYIFFYFYRSQLPVKMLKLNNQGKAITSVVLAFLTFVGLAVQYLVLASILNNSQWSLDITKEASISTFKLVSFLIFFINAIVYFTYGDLAIKVFQKLNEYRYGPMLLYYTLAALLFGALALTSGWPFLMIFLINSLYFLVLYLFRLPKSVRLLNYKSFSYFFVSATASALMAAFTIYNYEKGRLVEDKVDFAIQLLGEDDILGGFLLKEASGKIENDAFIQNRLFSPFNSKEIIKDKIKRVYLGNYFSKYDIDIRLYNANGNPLSAKGDSRSFQSIKATLDQEKYKTSYPQIYFVNEIGNVLSKRYYSLITVKNKGFKVNSGYIIIDLKLKRNIPDNVYPELLVDSRFPFLDKEYNYGIFSNGQLVYNAGNFNYLKDFSSDVANNSSFYSQGIIKNGYHHLGVKGNGNRLIVISSKLNPWELVISNFSLLFLLLAFCITIVLLCLMMYFSIVNIGMNLSTKIQLYLNVAIFMPLLVVTVSMLSQVYAFHNRDLNEQYFKNAMLLSRNITEGLQTYMHHEISREDFTRQLLRMASLTEIDVNIFRPNGRFLAGSQPLIFENKLLSKYMNPEAMKAIVQDHSKRILLNESIGKLFYKSVYVAINSPGDGKLLGVLSMPFFESQDEINSKAVEVLKSLISVFMVVFVGFFILSYFATKMLTYPLTVLSQKLKRTSLAAYNEPLEWETDDEIGKVVEEYNRMLIKLEESKKAISQSEKESAWREMAKQVAHEIKNPLTPMKLSLQHMKRLLPDQNGDSTEFAVKKIDILLDQVDTLSDIASSFSTFAQMPVPKNEEFEISSLLRQVVHLHNSEGQRVSSFINEGKYFVLGDIQLMGQAFTNLIINAFQAVPNSEEAKVIVSLMTSQNQKVIIEVKDNGAGIDAAIRDRVFLPNFSTKYTGSGIGLAIVKRGIEHAGGRIWFETEEGNGTSFFIELPLIDDPQTL